MHSNYPYRVLPVGTGAGVIAAGSDTEALALGEIGIFDADTGLSLDAAAAAGVRNFIIAMGAAQDGGATKDMSLKSQGQQININSISGYTLQCYTPGQNEIYRIQEIERDPECDREWGIKIEFRANTKLYNMNGHNRVVRTYVARTPCCDTGQTADSRDLMNDFYEQMLADYNNGHSPVLPVLYEEGADIDNPGADIPDYAVWKAAALATDYVGIRLEAQPLAANTFCNVPALYYKLNAFRLHLSFMGTFFCSDGSDFAELNANSKQIQPPLFPAMLGNDVKFLEYESVGYTKGEQHRIGAEASSGLPINQIYRANESGLYSTVTLRYSDVRAQGSRVNDRQMETIIAFENADNADLVAFLTVLDVLVSNRALADDAGTCAGAAVQASSKAVEVEGIEVN